MAAGDVIEFDRFYRLRAQVQNAFLRGGDSLACSGVDLALIAASEPPTAPGSRRFAACQDRYIVYTASPAITPPNLAAVQELSVGIVRVSDVGAGQAARSRRSTRWSSGLMTSASVVSSMTPAMRDSSGSPLRPPTSGP